MSLASSFQKESLGPSKYTRPSQKSQSRLVPSLNYKLKSKENLDAPLETCPSFRTRDSTSEIKHGREDITEKLKVIRKKYENQLAVNRSSIDRGASPLQELNNASKTPRYPEVDLSTNPKPTIQRTFSFINIESVESKPESVRYEEESFVEPVGERGDFGEWKTREFLNKKSVTLERPTAMFTVKEEKHLESRKFSYQPYERKGESEFDKIRDRISKDSYVSSKACSNSASKNAISIQNTDTAPEINGQRIESIDKINVRIKEILKSINDSDLPKTPPKANFNSELPSKSAKPLESFKSPALKLDYNKMYEEGTAPRHNVSCYPNILESAHSKDYPTASYKDQTSNNEPRTARYSVPRPPVKNEAGKNSDGQTDRPLTFRYSAQAQATPAPREASVGLPTRNSANVRSIKDLDREIEKIQAKIKHSEEEKRRLWNETTVIQRPSATPTSNEKPEPKRNHQQYDERASKYTLGNRIDSRHESRHESRQELSKPQKSTHQLADKYANCRYSTPNDAAIDMKSTFTVTSHSNKSTISNNDRIEEIRNRTLHHNHKSIHEANEESIPKAEKLTFKIMPISYDTEPDLPKDCQETRRFIEALKQQVSLDEELRNAKIWLDSAEIPNKWEAVRVELTKHHNNMSLQDVEKCFTNSLEEHNPFFTMKNYHESLSTVVEKYLASENFWQQSLRRKFNADLLKKERFEQDRLDLERKGFLTVEDFVRFLNIETGTFYRNRDLVLLFRRLTSQEKIVFQEFIGKVTTGN